MAVGGSFLGASSGGRVSSPGREVKAVRRTARGVAAGDRPQGVMLAVQGSHLAPELAIPNACFRCVPGSAQESILARSSNQVARVAEHVKFGRSPCS